MRRIKKNHPPAGFQNWRASNSRATYQDLSGSGKEATQEALCDEQGYLCAYCQSRIHSDGQRMRIEHWTAQSADDERTLAWVNLLGVCKGKTPVPEASSPILRKRARRSDEHCDRRRGNKPLHVHPARDADVAERFKYLIDGTITSDDEEVREDIATLNLGHARLAENRANVVSYIRRDLGSGPWSPPSLKRMLTRWTSRSSGRLLPYSGVAEYWLHRWLRKQQA